MLKTIVTGNIGQDAVIKDINSKKVLEFSMCHTRKYLNAKGVKEEASTWIKISKWYDKDIKIAEYLKKGTKVLVEGMPSTSAWITDDGELNHQLRINAHSIEILNSKTSKDE